MYLQRDASHPPRTIYILRATSSRQIRRFFSTDGSPAPLIQVLQISVQLAVSESCRKRRILRAVEGWKWNEQMKWLNGSGSRTYEWYLGRVGGFRRIMSPSRTRGSRRARRVIYGEQSLENKTTIYRAREFVDGVASYIL